MTADTLDTRQLNRALLARQGLLKRRRTPVAQAVHALAGLQSQEPKDPFVALWSRLSGFKGEQLRAAAQRHEIVRGSYLRATIHTVSASDYLAFRPLLQPVIDRELTSVHRRSISGGFDGAQVEPLARALMAQRPMSAQALGEALLPQFPGANKAGLGHWVRTRVPLAIVPSDDRWGFPRPPRFVPAEQWLQRPLAPASLAQLLLRGIAAIGPASSADLRAWSALGGIKPVLESLRPQLRVFRDERGRELFDLSDAPRPREDTPAPVRFLPEYDNVFLSHDDRARILLSRHNPHFTQTRNGRRLRAVLVDGFVRAAWSWQRVRDAATIRVQMFETFAKATQHEIGTEAEALLRFLEPDADRHAVELIDVTGSR
ncbi:winged helix DNA-binding domain-containing protein [Lysobacter cavernae]|uniref:Winged helix DNA-binding domain-containing protein n=1 Tax=Lysobacter cavernae TaxID=1685901 RepID=A0ABV7RRV7_9GAMM